MANHSTKSITIYQKTYQLPVLEDTSFQQIQSQIKQRQQIIKNQKRVIVRQKQIQKKSLFGLLSNAETINVKTTQELSFEDKFHELERLVKDYNQLISFLTEHKQVYLQFFAQLTSDLKQVVREKLLRLQKVEKVRLEKLARATGEDTISIYESGKEELLSYVWLTGKAFLLMLKKIELMSEGIEKITTDQDAQRELLGEMVKKLNERKEAYEFIKEMKKIKEETEILVETAINFEQSLKPFIGSFQGLIDQVCEQDNSLDGTVNEIKSLVEDIMLSNNGSFMSSRADDLSKNMLDFLVTNEQKKERLVTAVEDAQRQGIDWSWQQIDIQDCGDLTQAISALQTHIDGKLGEYSQEVEVVISPSYSSKQGNKTDFVEDLGNGVKLEMVYIPAGSFMMGTDDEEIERLCKKYRTDWLKNEAPQHQVTFKQDFYMGKYPITQAQYQAIMGKNPSHFSNAEKAPLSKGGWGDHPVECVSWNDAQEFCQKLSAKTGKKYKLPSESQWEYACRAGSKTKWCFGDDENQLSEYAWYRSNSNKQTHPVGQKKPNNWGLYDMHGNVCEWCEDDWHSDYKNAPDDGSSRINNDNHSQSGGLKVIRSGSWFSNPARCRSAYRSYTDPRDIDDYNGFRVVCS